MRQERRLPMPGILVSGATGLVGRYVLAALLEHGAGDLHALARGPLAAPLAGQPRLHRADITDAEGLTAALREVRPEVVIHPAAIADVDLSERDHALAHA